MFRLPSRATARLAHSSLAPARTLAGRRFITTQPPHLRSRSWKNSAARWGTAVAGIWFYTTSPIFAEEPSNNLLNPNLDKLEEETSGTSLEALTSQSRHQQSKAASVLASAAESASTDNASTTAAEPATGAQELEEEADQQGAFNPETGEINWDCPCLGGMAHGPCGPQFREAFSCFVYSTEEPKGMDCIEKFQGMQECFKEHPDVYKGELDEEGDDDGEYDEAMAAEKEELVKEIKERREKAGIEADRSPKKRLLDESGDDGPAPAKESKPKPKRQSESKKSTSESETATTPKKSASGSSKTPAETQPTATDSSDRSQESKATAEKSTTKSSVGPLSEDGQDLIPRAAHDASSAKVPNDDKPKP